MPRLTDDIGEIRKLAGLLDFVDEYGFRECRVFLTDDVAPIIGCVLPARVGNNAGNGGRWMYYGSIVIRTANEDIEVDFLDLDRAEFV